MTFVSDCRTLLRYSLRSYGEEELARLVPHLSDAEIAKIQELARGRRGALGVPTHPTGPSDRLTRKLSMADCLAAIEVMEGTVRQLKRKRRLLRGIFGRND